MAGVSIPCLSTSSLRVPTVATTRFCLLNLSAVPKPDDAADAVAIALCHARSFTSRLQSPDAARPGSGRYEVRKQVR